MRVNASEQSQVKVAEMMMDAPEKNLPKVSVIIPVYNAQAHMVECLDSISAQTLKDIEVICVDDCSKDDSLKILYEYSEKFDALKIIQQPENMGAGPARNKGLKAARGQYIAFMDADDSYPDENTLKLMYETAVSKKALICGGGVLFQFADRIEPGRNGNEKYYFDEEGWIEYSDYQQYYYYQRFLFNNEMLRKNEITFPHYLRFQDPPFFVKAMVTAGRFYVLKEPAYVYRNDSTHVKWNDRKINDFLKGASDILKLSQENKLGTLYFQTLNRFLNNKYILGILETSLIGGNDEILNFYRNMIENLDEELLGNEIKKLDLQYAQILSKAKLNRNMQFNHRPFELQDGEDEGNKPKVSVIIPVYNTEKYLSLCLGSIVGQTLEDIEIICVNDGSTDGCADILAKFERKNSNLYVYHQENGGLSAARNTGLQHARGEYVYFMDSDDYLDLTALEDLYNIATADQLDVVYFGAKSFFEDQDDALDKKNLYYVNAYRRNGSYPDVMTGKEMLVKQQKNKDYYTSVCIQFYRTQYLRDNELMFYEGLLHEDNLFSIAAMVKAQKVRCINNTYFYRRVRHDSIMTTPTNYRNILGYYLTAIEEVKLFKNTEFTADERGVLVDKIQALFKSNLNYKWGYLHRADQVLFLASLTAEDRLLFESFVLPMIEYHERIRKSPKDVQEANQQKQKLNAEITKLKNEISNLKKTTVSKNSVSYRVGRICTYVPRKIRGGIRCYKEHGMGYTVKRVFVKLKKRIKRGK